MRSTRSIAGLMALIILLGLMIAALMRPSPLAAACWLAATLGLLTIAGIGALHARGPSRAFWSGFAIAGWLALVVHFAPWFRSQAAPLLASTAALDVLYGLIAPEDPSQVADTPIVISGVLNGGVNPPGTFPTLPGSPSLGGAVTATFELDRSTWEQWTTAGGFPTIAHGAGGFMPSPTPPDCFMRCGYCLVALACGLIGGLAGRWFASSDRSSPTA